MFQDINQLSGLYRLRDVAIHPCGQASLLVALDRVGCHGDDRQVPAGVLFSSPYGGGGLEPIHLRHLHVHQHDIEAFLIEGGEGFALVGRHRHPVSVLFHQT